MKTITFLFLTIFTVARLYSQSYEIDFAGTGASAVVDSVKVVNQGISLTLNGNDVLKLNVITVIHNIASDIKSLQIYPNPMTEQAEIQFFVNKSSKVLLAVYDVSGRPLIQSGMFLNPGMHKYCVSGLYQGMYIVRINEQNSIYTAKLVSKNRLNEVVKIENVYSESIQSNQIGTKQLKSTASTIDMAYSAGDRLKFTGISSNYRTVLTDVPSGNHTITFDFIDCTDDDDNHYPVVKIGTQTWMAQNLKTTKYNDGTPIPLVTDAGTWVDLSTPAYCWYNNDSATYSNTYGSLYNWHTVNTGKLCPTGWHVPTDAEWTTLTTYLGGESIAGGKLKETDTTHWYSPNTGANNETGFTALPGGYRSSLSGTFDDVGNYGAWWSSTEYDTEYDALYAWRRYMSNDYRGVTRGFSKQQRGLSVRCLGN